MRRRQTPRAAQPGVPEEIAEGPRVSRWSHLADLDRLTHALPGTPGVRDRVDGAMLSAFRRYRSARARWVLDEGLDRREASTLAPSRRPYFDLPGTPLPARIGYAAEPQASDRAWIRISGAGNADAR